MMLRLLTIIAVIGVEIVSTQQRCASGVQYGKTCSQNKATTKWFFDTKMSFCYPYQFLGCEEGPNSFNSQEECLAECKPADQFSCGGNTDSKGVCFSPSDKGCKQTNVCVMGGTVGFCCDKVTQEQWNNENSPKCSNGEAVQIKMWFGKIPLIGRNCDHKFCPTGSKCVQGKWTAHCCK